MSLALRRRVMKVAAAVVSGVTDSFNRANSTTTMGVADTGQTWVPNSGTWGIDLNRARLVSATAQASTVVDSGLADGTVESLLVVHAANGCGLCFRSTNDANYLTLDNATGAVYRRQAGAFTLIGNANIGYTSGDVMAVVLSGSSIVLKKNGTSILSVTDAFNATATRHGYRADNKPEVRWDNFSVAA